MFVLVVFLLVLSGTLKTAVGVIALQRRYSQLAVTFAVCCFLAVLWDYGFAAETISPTLDGKIFWADIQFFGITFLPVAWLAMTLLFTGQPLQMRRLIPFLGIIPLVTNVMIWTNPYHHLFRQNPYLNTIGVPFPVLVSDYGSFFYAVHAPYGYFLFLVSLVFLIHSWRQAPAVIRKQRLMLVLSLMVPLTVDVLYTFGITPIPSFNFASTSFTFSGIVLGINVLSLRFLDILPMAYETAINSMNVGVIALDGDGRVSNINPAAAVITDANIDQVIGFDARQVFPILDPLWKSASGSAEVVMSRGEKDSTYQLQTTRIMRGEKKAIGQVITIHDISERARLHRIVEEMAITDALTGALNRRALTIYGEKEIKMAHRYHYELALVMLDVDNFKEINDRFGHQIGDNVLRGMVQTIQSRIRINDLLFRYGGDEFVLLLHETNLAEAIKTGERIRAELARLEPEGSPSMPGGIMVSQGVTLLQKQDNLETMLHRADQALYLAKTDGKNKIVVDESIA